MEDFHDQYSDIEISCEKPIQIPINDNIKYSVKNIDKNYMMIY